MVAFTCSIPTMSNHTWASQWQKVINQLQSQLPSQKFDAWIHPLEAKMIDNKLVISCASNFFINGLKADCGSMFEDCIYAEFGLATPIHYEVASPQEIKVSQKKAVPSVVDGNIDPRFTFKNFIVGSSNEFAFAACQAVAEKPGESYNPLYLHGGVGLGKTHLIHAISNQLSQKPDIKIAYRTGERFTNELIKAIGSRSTDQFREHYRKVDVLIIDDVQFIAGKTSTQEEFFHTFNALHEVHKQIILVSDRNPHDMSHLEERLRSRFNWGLVADIQPPNLETRLAILASKTELAGITLDKDVSYLLASRITNNVRELEGALTRLTAFSHLTKKSIDIDMAKNVLREQLHVVVRSITIEDIQKKIADYYGIAPKEMKSNRRTRNIAFPRQVAMYISKELTQASLPEIGSCFGGRDHTTVLYAHRKIDAQRQEDRPFDDEISHLLKTLRG
ncbi:MAG: chromosomal replication initiator protein DnaA [Mariprofundaceae bacterium]|nr:chromosomal replication initiator protein DnaA [Mariprofundaceae bacterium]